MIARLFAATARHRRPVLLGGAVAAVGQAASAALDPFSGARPAVVVMVQVLLLLLAVASLGQARPVTFDVRPDLTALVAPPPVASGACARAWPGPGDKPGQVGPAGAGAAGRVG
jgi:hypothetical protein